MEQFETLVYQSQVSQTRLYNVLLIDRIQSGELDNNGNNIVDVREQDSDDDAATRIYIYTSNNAMITRLVTRNSGLANAQVTISANKSLPRDGDTVNLICNIPSFIVPASWGVYTSGVPVSLTNCPPSGPCVPPNDAARYIYSATGSSIGVTITSFNSMQDTFGWRCQHGKSSVVYVIKPVVPVTTVQLTNTSDEILTSTLNIVRGGIMYIRCSTAPHGSRPPATFQWYSRTVNQSPVLIGNQSISSTPGSIMVPGQPDSDLLISYSTLTQTGAKMYQNMFIFCEARDEMSTGNYTQSGEVQLNIVYPPMVQLSPNYSVYNVTEGTHNVVFTCNIIESNPLPQSDGYNWFHKSLIIQGQTSSSLTLASVHKSDDGEYRCTAKNDYGSGASNSLALNVQYGAEIVNLTAKDSNVVNENSSASFQCYVESNPLPTVTWAKEGNNTVLITETGVIQSQFRIESAQCIDMGNYSCTAYNGIGSAVKETVQLFVKCHPRTDFRFPPETKIYRKPHTAAILRYTVISYPLPIFTWTFLANGNESRDLPASVIQHDGIHQSELSFTSLDIDNFGYYLVTANNSVYPSAKEVFEIILADVPEVPSNVTVTDLTQNRLTIQWTAGYNGGPEQTFHIIASVGEFTRSVTVADPGHGNIGHAVLESLLPGTRYSIYMTASNSIGSSNKTDTITIVTPEAASKPESLGIPVPGIAGGTVAGFFVILCLVIGIFFWRRYQHAKQNEHVTDDDIKRERDESPVKQEAASGKMYEGLHFTEVDASQYQELNDIVLEEKRNANIRPPEKDSYEKLHPYTNSDIQMYSSLTNPVTSKDSEEKYENTCLG
ncbi:hypothetical protein ACJMK2_022627 [Sinanodonta woodiana]|uniref:Uncharacterized protein n=1 Tax=Sinanodonta woodiana TaxID=1069815 RepID=A0ABD3TJN3_SINWO